jgi:hypothetical protein
MPANPNPLEEPRCSEPGSSLRIWLMLIVLSFVLLGMLLIRNQFRLRRAITAVADLESQGVSIQETQSHFWPLVTAPRPSQLAYSLSDCAKIDWAPLKDLTGITQISLDGTTNTDVGLTACRGFGNLSNVFLESSDVTRAGMNAIAGLPIVSLGLGNTHITAEDLRPTLRMTSLERLDLHRTQIRPSEITWLAQHPTLEILDFRDGRTEDADLTAFDQFRRLKLIILDGSRVTQAAVIELRDRLPGIRIHWNGQE